MATLKDALATLATVPPKAFTRERDALAARLRDAGDTTAAAKVKARRVPTLPVWIVNRLALEHPDDVEALIAAAARVKAAQLGRGQAGTLATATAGHRAALDRLRERAGVMLRDAGGVTADKLLRVQNTLTAAAVDAQARATLQAGHLERELTAPGFDVFGGARPPAARGRMGAKPAHQGHGPATDRRGDATGGAEGRGTATRARGRASRAARGASGAHGKGTDGRDRGRAAGRGRSPRRHGGGRAPQGAARAGAAGASDRPRTHDGRAASGHRGDARAARAPGRRTEGRRVMCPALPSHKV